MKYKKLKKCWMKINNWKIERILDGVLEINKSKKYEMENLLIINQKNKIKFKKLKKS